MSRPRRVLIFSADIGEGHATAARALARALRATGAEVHIREDLASLGRLNRLVLRDGSRVLFRWAPWIYDLHYRSLVRSRLARGMAAGSLARLGQRPLLRMVRELEPDVIVSTYPAVTVVLGKLRHRGKLAIPVVATITDLAGLFFWAHPGIDLHLTSWEESLAEVRKVAGDAEVRHVGALTSSEFFTTRTREAARRDLSLPLRRPVIVVSGGGWGIGHLGEAVATACAVPAAFVVCVAGRNQRVRAGLEAAFADDPNVRILGFSDRMSDLLTAADVLVHATGGVTCLEAGLRGCPVVIHGFSSGHVRHNAEALSSRGLARRARTTRELGDALRELVDTPALVASSPARADAAELVLAARPVPRPPGGARAPRARRRVAVAVASAGVALSTSPAFSLAARGLDLDPLTHVPTSRPQVALVVDAPVSDISQVAAELRRQGATASFGVSSAPSPRVTNAAAHGGLELMPSLPGGEPVRWLSTGRRLSRMRDALGLPRRFRYLLPPSDITLGEYLLARKGGGQATAPRLTISSVTALRSRSVSRGDVIALRLAGPPAGVAREVDSMIVRLRTLGLEPSSVAALTRSASNG